MYILDNDYIEKNLVDLMCSYGEDNFSSVLFDTDFQPESFTLYDKKKGETSIFFPDLKYVDWIMTMIQDEVSRIDDLQPTSRLQLEKQSFSNFERFAEYQINGHPIGLKLYNQEVIDIVRRIIAFTLYGDAKFELYTAKKFNALADRIIPLVLTELSQKKFPLNKLLALSIISGLSGLDLKGAPAAASSYANDGIPMRRFLEMDSRSAVDCYFNSLLEVFDKCTFPLFQWDFFETKLQKSKKLVWLTDDYIESYFDLFFIGKILNTFNITVEVIPKNGRHGNDLSEKDVKTLLACPVFKNLEPYLDQGQLFINQYGPRMGAANIKKFSDSMAHSIAHSDILVMKGCRIHEMLQGGLNIPSFSAYIVARTLSEQVSGFDSSNYPVLFFHLNPGEYSFWGISRKDSIKLILPTGKSIDSAYYTTQKHAEAISENDLSKIVDQFNLLSQKSIDYSGHLRPLFQEMNLLAEKIIRSIESSYDAHAVKYSELRKGKQGELTLLSWDILSQHVDRYLTAQKGDIKLLDVGAAGGQGILRSQEFGYQAYGIDISEVFVSLLRCHPKITNKDKEHIRKCDSRSIDFEDNFFDVVRQSASLLHIPVIAKGYACDLALSESNRVLKKGGLLFISVKKGNGIVLQDTNEGLGVRAFQLFTVEQMVAMLQRNGFETIFIQEFFERRNTYKTSWLIFIARKTI